MSVTAAAVAVPATTAIAIATTAAARSVTATASAAAATARRPVLHCVSLPTPRRGVRVAFCLTHSLQTTQYPPLPALIWVLGRLPRTLALPPLVLPPRRGAPWKRGRIPMRSLLSASQQVHLGRAPILSHRPRAVFLDVVHHQRAPAYVHAAQVVHRQYAAARVHVSQPAKAAAAARRRVPGEADSGGGAYLFHDGQDVALGGGRGQVSNVDPR